MVGETTPKEDTPVKLTLEYLYLDRTSCTRCRGTNDSLEAAAALLRPVLRALGAELEVSRVHVTSAAQAESVGLRTSPTLRVNGRDLQPDFAESRCGSCSDLAPAAGGVECREWTWGGRTWTEAPVGLIVEGVLRAVLTPEPGEAPPAGLPENLRRFFEAGEPCCGGTPGRGCC